MMVGRKIYHGRGKVAQNPAKENEYPTEPDPKTAIDEYREKYAGQRDYG